MAEGRIGTLRSWVMIPSALLNIKYRIRQNMLDYKIRMWFALSMCRDKYLGVLYVLKLFLLFLFVCSHGKLKGKSGKWSKQEKRHSTGISREASWDTGQRREDQDNPRSCLPGEYFSPRSTDRQKPRQGWPWKRPLTVGKDFPPDGWLTNALKTLIMKGYHCYLYTTQIDLRWPVVWGWPTVHFHKGQHNFQFGILMAVCTWHYKACIQTAPLRKRKKSTGCWSKWMGWMVPGPQNHTNLFMS